MSELRIIESRNGKTTKLVYENYRNDGRVRSKVTTVEYDPLKDVGKCDKFVPRWLVIVSLIGFSLVAFIFVTTIVMTLTIPRPSLYSESCDRRSCLNDLNLSCINKTCLCLESQFYSNKCEEKRGHLHHCRSTYQCKENTNMTCRDGLCKCSNIYYWNSRQCVERKAYLDRCSVDDECRIDLMLVCDTSTGTCGCPITR